MEVVREWLLACLQGVYAPAGRHGVSGYCMTTGALTHVEFALRPHVRQRQVVVLQAATRRTLQRRVLVCEQFDAHTSSWNYSRCATRHSALPAHTYWPPTAAQQTAVPGKASRGAQLIPNYGHSNYQRLLALVLPEITYTHTHKHAVCVCLGSAVVYILLYGCPLPALFQPSLHAYAKLLLDGHTSWTGY